MKCLLRPLSHVCCEIVLALGPMVCACLGECGVVVELVLGLGARQFGWWAYSLPLGLSPSIFFDNYKY